MSREEMRKAFMADIVANPEDMTPRLIFADWLEDNGDPERAEFIRVEVELDRLERERGKDKKAIDLWLPMRDLEIRRHELLVRNGRSWTGGIRRFFDFVGSTAFFRRGFVEEVHAPLSVLEEHLPALVQEHPLLVVRATDKEPVYYAHRGVQTWWKNFLSNYGLPEHVWDLLEEHPCETNLRAKDYPDVDAAYADLSKALLKLARSKVQPCRTKTPAR